MRVILQKDVPNLGSVGDIVRVKDGYGRNFLVPQGLAVVADERNVHRLEHQKRMAEAMATRELAAAQSIAAELENNPVTIWKDAGEDGKIHGSVTNREIAEAFGKDGFTVDRRQIQLDGAINSIGVNKVQIKLDRGVQATVTVYVQSN